VSEQSKLDRLIEAKRSEIRLSQVAVRPHVRVTEHGPVRVGGYVREQDLVFSMERLDPRTLRISARLPAERGYSTAVLDLYQDPIGGDTYNVLKVVTPKAFRGRGIATQLAKEFHRQIPEGTIAHGGWESAEGLAWSEWLVEHYPAWNRFYSLRFYVDPRGQIQGPDAAEAMARRRSLPITMSVWDDGSHIVVLAVAVRPHVRVVDGKIVHVEGYLRRQDLNIDFDLSRYTPGIKERGVNFIDVIARVPGSKGPPIGVGADARLHLEHWPSDPEGQWRIGDVHTYAPELEGHGVATAMAEAFHEQFPEAKLHHGGYVSVAGANWAKFMLARHPTWNTYWEDPEGFLRGPVGRAQAFVQRRP
jgi:predicted GNAT family acetyltransferase